MILVDTGVIFAAADHTDVDHRACVDLLTAARLAGHELLLPPTVAAELGHLLQTRLGPWVETAVMKGIGEGDFTPIDLTGADYVRIGELLEKYEDLPLGVTDASVVALAERFGIDEIATLDHRHFRVVRPRHVDALTLLPEGIA